MGQLKFNIDNASDDEFFAVTEGLALAGQVMEEKGSGTLLTINLSAEGGMTASSPVPSTKRRC